MSFSGGSVAGQYCQMAAVKHRRAMDLQSLDDVINRGFTVKDVVTCIIKDFFMV